MIVVGVLAYSIGLKQNEINQRSLKLNDYADVFLMPQTLQDNNKNVVGWNILIKNASAYPVYLNKYIINGAVFNVGTSMIPANSGDWYQVPVTKDIQEKKYFSISIFFEDYSGRKYQTEGVGEFNGSAWGVKTQKRQEL